MEKKDLGIEFSNSFSKEHLVEIASDLGEVFIDAVLEDGIAKDIPILGIFVNIYNKYRSYQNYAYLKKVTIFLSEIGCEPSQDRDAFLSEIEKEQGGRQQFGETILTLLDRMDDSKKAVFIAKICIARMKGKINFPLMYRLFFVIDRCYFPDLEALKERFNGKPISTLSAYNLNSLGLVYSLRRIPEKLKLELMTAQEESPDLTLLGSTLVKSALV